MSTRAAGSDPTSAVGTMHKTEKFFLIIEDEDYSKSRTKIGLSVDK